MRTRLIIVGVAAIIALMVIGYLYTKGYFQNFQWQTATMIFAALAGPYKLVVNWIKGDADKISLIEDNQSKLVEEERQLRLETERKLKESQAREAAIKSKVEQSNQKLETIETKRSETKKEVENMTSDELKNAGQELFG